MHALGLQCVSLCLSRRLTVRFFTLASLKSTPTPLHPHPKKRDCVIRPEARFREKLCDPLSDLLLYNIFEFGSSTWNLTGISGYELNASAPLPCQNISDPCNSLLATTDCPHSHSPGARGPLGLFPRNNSCHCPWSLKCAMCRCSELRLY